MYRSITHSHKAEGSALDARRGVFARTVSVCLALALLLCPLACFADGSLPGSSRNASGGSEEDAWAGIRSLFPAPTEGAVATSAHAHVLIEADSGAVLEQKNADARLPMASTTKIMTALVALETLPTDTVVSVPREAVGVEGSSVYLVEGETLTLGELLYALLLESANDAAVAVAVAVGGSVDGFADMMNRRAGTLGLCDTHFTNPHGLDDPDHYTTARELALIARAALALPAFREIVSTVKKTIPLHTNEGVRLLINHNKMLRLYDGCIGVKTGFTKRTGRCLVSAAERDGVRLIAVTLGAPDDWRDHTALLDHGFTLCRSVTPVEAGAYSLPLWVVSGDKEYTLAGNADALRVTLPASANAPAIVVELPRFVFAPLEAGDVVGSVLCRIRADGRTVVLGRVPLTAACGVGEITYRRTLWERLNDWLYALFHRAG